MSVFWFRNNVFFDKRSAALNYGSEMEYHFRSSLLLRVLSKWRSPRLVFCKCFGAPDNSTGFPTTGQDLQLRLVVTESEGELVGSCQNSVKHGLTQHTTHWRPVHFKLFEATLYHGLLSRERA